MRGGGTGPTTAPHTPPRGGGVMAQHPTCTGWGHKADSCGSGRSLARASPHVIPGPHLPLPPPPRGCHNNKKKKLGVSNTPYDGGRWVTDGGWWVTDGVWCVTDGGWWVTDGGWWVTDGGWWVTDGGWCVTDGGWWVIDGGWCVTDGGWCVTDGGWWVATKHQRVAALVKKKKAERPYGNPCPPPTTAPLATSPGTRGAACSNSRPQPGAETFGGLKGRGWVVGGGLQVGRSAAGSPLGGGGGVSGYPNIHTPK